MAQTLPTLHILCGKIAAGKSTLSASLAADENTVLVSEDEWLKALYADQMTTPKDFMRCAGKFREAIAPHIIDLLNSGLSVVLDFQANTVESRAWMQSLIDKSGAAHQLHLLDAPDEVLLARLRARNAEGAHAFSVTEEHFRQVSKYFVPPTDDEGFNIVRHDPNDQPPSADA